MSNTALNILDINKRAWSTLCRYCLTILLALSLCNIAVTLLGRVKPSQPISGILLALTSALILIYVTWAAIYFVYMNLDEYKCSIGQSFVCIWKRLHHIILYTFFLGVGMLCLLTGITVMAMIVTKLVPSMAHISTPDVKTVLSGQKDMTVVLPLIAAGYLAFAWLSTGFLFGPYYVLCHQQGAFKAIASSIKLVWGRWWHVFFVMTIPYLLHIIDTAISLNYQTNMNPPTHTIVTLITNTVISAYSLCVLTHTYQTLTTNQNTNN